MQSTARQNVVEWVDQSAGNLSDWNQIRGKLIPPPLNHMLVNTQPARVHRGKL